MAESLADTMSIAWGITGAGHFLRECVTLLQELKEVDGFLSRAASEVLRLYRLADELRRANISVIKDRTASGVSAGHFSGGRYRVLVVAPATSNSVAKFICGISDSLITNLFAQAGKSGVPIIVQPTDISAEMDSLTPKGKRIKVYPRPIDLENTASLRKIPGVTVIEDMEGLRKCLASYL